MMDKVQINSLEHCILGLSNSFILMRFEVLTVILLRIEVFLGCDTVSDECFPVFQRNAVPLSPRVKQSKKNSQHRESVVKCGYSGNDWWVAGMVVNTEKDPQHPNHLNLLYHLKSTNWVHVQVFLKVGSDDMMVDFILVFLVKLLIKNTMNLWEESILTLFCHVATA